MDMAIGIILGATFGKVVSGFFVDFLIIALTIFMVVRVINYLKPEKTEAVSAKACPRCCADNDLQASRCRHCTTEI